MHIASAGSACIASVQRSVVGSVACHHTHTDLASLTDCAPCCAVLCAVLGACRMT